MNLILKIRIIQCFGTQRALARLLQISDDRLSGIVQGRIVPSMPEKEIIAKKLGTQVKEVFPEEFLAQQSYGGDV